ncbi:MAG: class I SAM-dependent methyltransferase [Candidatus Desulfofervidus sp.]|nr:class I SAM-dependent methyltransferase [Candidatus Desulfofervidus sp.]
MGFYYWYSTITGHFKKADIEKWFKSISKESLKRVGIKKGQILLDFGAGMGYYTLPAAQIIQTGKVYAIDRERSCLKNIKKIAHKEGINNIEVINTQGEIFLPFKDGVIDVILLYDVLHSHYFTPNKRIKLLKEIYRISKHEGLISVYPKHMDLEEIKKDMKMANFCLKEELALMVIHDNSLVKDKVLNFKKY